MMIVRLGLPTSTVQIRGWDVETLRKMAPAMALDFKHAGPDAKVNWLSNSPGEKTQLREYINKMSMHMFRFSGISRMQC